MKVKLLNYVVDSKDKESILKIAYMGIARGIECVLIDGKEGGYDKNPTEPGARMLVLNTRIYREFRFSGTYSTIDTPYGRYVSSEKTMYEIAKHIYKKLEKLETQFQMVDALYDSNEKLSDMSNIVIKNFVLEEDEYLYADKARELLQSIDVDTNVYSDKDLNWIYYVCLHDFCKTGNFDVCYAKYELIDKGKLNEKNEQLKYMNTEFKVLEQKEIAEAKSNYYAL